MSATSDYPGPATTAVDADIYTNKPSKDFQEKVKRNSQRGERRCARQGCTTILSLSNDDLYCRTCEKTMRLERISQAHRKYVNSSDLDFDK